MNYLAAFLFVVARLKEASSYAGIAGFLAALNVPNSGSVALTITQIGMAVAGVLAVLIPEKK